MVGANTSRDADAAADANEPAQGRDRGPDMRPVIVYLAQGDTADRLRSAIEAQDARPVLAQSGEDFVTAVDYWFPMLAILDGDLATAEKIDWQAAVQRCKLRPHTRPVPILVIGDPVFDNGEPLAGKDQDGKEPAGGKDSPPAETTPRSDATLDAAAREVGADAVYTRADFQEHLTQILRDAIQPPTVYPEGWDDPLTEKARTGVDEFNRREFYEQHEWLEHAWMDETRPIREMYQGILQVGVAFYHIERGNWAGALKMFRRGLPRLRALPPVCQGLDIAGLRAEAETIHREVTELGRERLHEFDTARFPQIRLVENNGEQ